MALPIRTTIEDLQAVCAYLTKKPTGATLKEAKAVLDGKRLDGRKLSALKFWGLLEDQDDRLKITSRGREAVRDNGAKQATVLAQVVKGISPYNAIVERAVHSELSSITALEVAAHWHDHFLTEVSGNEKILNDQAVCFFQLAAGAALGSLVIGRKGSPTRFEFERDTIEAFAEGSLPTYEPASNIDGAKQDKPRDAEDKILPPTSANSSERGRPTGEGIFIAHGKNKKPLEELKHILDQFKIPYKVAVEEPNLGRPIGTKVRDLMESCNCAILIFTADEEFKDADGNTVWRPSENVVYELGAAGFLYDKRIVILKEEDVQFPTNFKDLGYIAFTKNQLGSQSMEVLKELIGFGIVKVFV